MARIPYMLLNYNETLDAVFTLAHEMGHSMHTLLSHRAQPFVYAGYTIFVAEVPSTLNEALFLDLMLERADSREQRAVLLQHAIDSIASTFYTQVMFADFELQAHRLVEQDQPVTADAERHLRTGCCATITATSSTTSRSRDDLGAHPALLQHALLRLSIRHLLRVHRPADAGPAVTRGDARRRRGALSSLLRAGGSDYPMDLLARAGVDLSQPDTVRAVATELDTLVAAPPPPRTPPPHSLF